jgi:predicted AAA+ superfamily ATPase
MQGYRPRIIDRILADYLQGLPAVCIDGAKGVGKTSSAQQICATEIHMDNKLVQDILNVSSQLIKEASKPVLIDEWQLLPHVWDYVRRLVDENNSPGQYVLTGSAYPKKANVHSDAARIVHLRMRPLSIEERQIDSPVVRIKDLLNREPLEISGSTDVTIDDYLYEISQSGFPAINQLSATNARRQLDGYIDNIVEREFENLGYSVRNSDALRNWLASYAAAQGTTATYATILDAASPGQSNKPSAKTTQNYRDVLNRLWLIDDVEPWLPIASQFKYLGKTPKHFLVDPALSMRLLNLEPNSFTSSDLSSSFDAKGKTILGRFFEALIAQSLKTYAQANDATLHHFRSSNGAREIDFIIQRARQLVLIEVKLAGSVEASDLRHLHWFESEFPEYAVAKCVINAGSYAYTREDGVHVIPAALLGA